jgi:hypothetical protein
MFGHDLFDASHSHFMPLSQKNNFNTNGCVFSSKILTHLFNIQGIWLLRLPRLHIAQHNLINLTYIPNQQKGHDIPLT